MVAVVAMLRPVYAQQPHVELRYFKDIDKTVVSSDLMYVVNMPSQFLQMQLIGRYPKQGKPQQLPDRISLQIFSYTTQPFYQQDDARRLQVKADERIFELGLLDYSRIEEKSESKSGSKKTVLNVRAALPQTALIAANRSISLVVETMSISGIPLADLNTIAHAQSVLFKIGDTVFPLTPMHLTILREFVEAITPANADVRTGPAPNVPVSAPAGVPSDDNHAPLDATLSWMKRQIEREGSTDDPVLPRRVEPIDFSRCHVSFRLTPLVRTSPVSSNLVYAIMEYQVDLADLNPESVAVSNLSEYAMVSMTTRNAEKKIKIFKHANQSGVMGRTLDEGTASSALMKFKSVAAARDFKFALVHAVNLCQAKSSK